MGYHVWWHDHGAGEAQYAHHSFFFSPGQFVVFVAGLIAAGMTIDLAGFLPCTSLSALSAPVALTRTGVEAPVAQAKAALDDLPEKFPQWILGGNKFAFEDFSGAQVVAENMTKILTAELRQALFWSVHKTPTLCNEIRTRHENGTPHLAVAACWRELQRRASVNAGPDHDIVLEHGVPKQAYALRHVDRLAAANAAADAALREAAEQANIDPYAPRHLAAEFGRVLSDVGRSCMEVPHPIRSFFSDGLEALETVTPLAKHTEEFVPGHAQDGAGDDVVTLLEVLKSLPRSGEDPKVLCCFHAKSTDEGDTTATSVPIYVPTLDDVLAPWGRRRLRGFKGRADLTQDSALIMAPAPREMLYEPPRRDDIYFWGPNQQAWIDLNYLDRMLFFLNPRYVIYNNGDKPEADCGVSKVEPGDVRHSRSRCLLEPRRVLRAGAKGAHVNNGPKGVDGGQGPNARHSDFKFYNLNKEVEDVCAGTLIEILSYQKADDHRPPKFCVVAKDRGEAFKNAAAEGTENSLYTTALERYGFEFEAATAAAQRIINAFEAQATEQPYENLLQASSPDPDDTRAVNLAARVIDEKVWATRGYSVVSCPFAGKNQFLIWPGTYEEALRQGFGVRMAVYATSADSPEPNTWRHLTVHNKIDTGKMRCANVYGAKQWVATPVGLADIWSHYFLAKDGDGQRSAVAVFSATTKLLARTRYSELSSSGYSARECLGIFYIDRFSASSHVQTDFHYSHLRDRPSVAAEGHQPSRSEIMRSLAVSPALDGAGTAARLHDLDRLYGLVVRGEEEGDRVHDEQWLPAAPARTVADQLRALVGADS